MKRYAILTVGILLMATGAFAQSTATADAFARIIGAITVTNTGGVSLNFGTIAPGAASSDIRVATDGTRSLVSGDATLVTDAANAPTAATFEAVGAGAYAYDISVAKLSDLSCGACGGADIVLSALTLSAATGSGTTAFTVGGDITVPSGQTAGDYTGSIEVTVEYQ